MVFDTILGFTLAAKSTTEEFTCHFSEVLLMKI